MQYNVLEARNQLSKLIDAAEAGEEVVIARRGKPVVKLTLVEDQPALGTSAALAKVFAGWEELPPRSAEEIEAELREIKQGWRERE